MSAICRYFTTIMTPLETNKDPFSKMFYNLNNKILVNNNKTQLTKITQTLYYLTVYKMATHKWAEQALELIRLRDYIDYQSTNVPKDGSQTATNFWTF